MKRKPAPNPHGPIVVYRCTGCNARWATYRNNGPPAGWDEDEAGRKWCPRCQRRPRKRT